MGDVRLDLIEQRVGDNDQAVGTGTAVQSLQLSVPEGGGRLLPDSSRILNFRVLRCAWVDRPQNLAIETPPPGTFHFCPADVFQLAKEDIAPAAMGLRFGRGWYPVECNHGVWSRWVGNDASIAVEAPTDSGQILSMELQPGPGVDHRPFTLQVQDPTGVTVAQGVVGGREIVHLPSRGGVLWRGGSSIFPRKAGSTARRPSNHRRRFGISS